MFIGNPAPKVTWWIDGSLYDSTDEMTRLGRTLNHMVYPSLTREDLFKVFTCQASNTNRTLPASRKVKVILNCKYLSQTYKCTLSQIMGFLKQNLTDRYVHLLGNMLGPTFINLDYMICKSSNSEVSFDLVCCSPKHCKKRRDMVPLLSTCQATIDFCVKNQCHFYPVRHIMWKLLYLLTNNVLQGFISL